MVIQIKKGIIKHVTLTVKNSSPCICEDGKYLKSIANESVIVCNEIINVTNHIATSITNTCCKYYINECHEYCVIKYWW